ncbi:MAG TPA: hypothetical protein PKB02_10830 [Anaerohalosphaeraceae bacterium]|nr:hypothetical protein [Anaerohalosphaeraceae bacterium]
MLSEKQLIANRNNCLKSTGPRTAEGKAAVAQNAMRHGLRSGRIIIRGESLDQYEQFRNDVLAQLAPEGPIEARLAGRIADCLWRLERAGRIESEWLEECQSDFVRQQTAAALKAAKEQREQAERKKPGGSFRQSVLSWLKTRDGQAYLEDRWPSEKGTANESYRRFLNGESDDSMEDLTQSIIDKARAELQARKQGLVPPAEQMQQALEAKLLAAQEDFEGSLGPAVAQDMGGKDKLIKLGRYETHLERCLYRAMAEFRTLQHNRLHRIMDGTCDESQMAFAAQPCHHPSIVDSQAVAQASALEHKETSDNAAQASLLENEEASTSVAQASAFENKEASANVAQTEAIEENPLSNPEVSVG